MDFYAVLDQVMALLRQRGRASYRALKVQFQLDDEQLAALKEELIDIQEVAVDKDGKMLVWIAKEAKTESENRGAGETETRRAIQDPQSSNIEPRAAQPPFPGTQSPAERRQLTVMFCDLVGSTALSEKLDPEELHEVVRTYQQTSTAVIEHYAGHIAQHLGDGLLVYFGYPTAHEDDAQRAVRAALGIVEAIQQLSFPTIRLPRALQVRIGIHTGVVVVGEMGSSAKREMLALGETPNLAARLQELAEPDTVVISTPTQRLVSGLFECQELGPQTLKGISTPMTVYRISGEGTARSRFEVAVTTGLTPLVGREEEFAVLQRRWDYAKAGAGQVVLLSGEAGIGKSRLVQALKEHVLAEGATRLEFRCSPYRQNSALYPIIEHLQRLLQFHREESPQAKLEKLRQTLAQYRFPQAETFPLLAALLSLPHPERTPPLTLSPQQQKQKTQEALAAWLVEEAERQVVYCAWEDLHWADPSTLEFLTLLLDQAPTTRLLTVLTFRPDFTPPWRTRAHFTQLTLSPLGRQPVEAMVEKLTSGKPLPREVLQQIVRRTDGVPLFVEELTKMLLESGLLRAAEGSYELTGPVPPSAIPSTLQDALMARLDRLAPVRELAQLGATLGREFSYDLLHAVSSLNEETLQQGLRQLVEAELIYQHDVPSRATYLFKHALVQDVAYQSLLKSKRQQSHRQIAQVLEERFPEIVETQPEVLAYHYTEAGLPGQALPYWRQAGQRAVQRSANVEAVEHFTKGLDLLPLLPDTLEHTQRELTLQLALAIPLVATKGWSAPEVEKVYSRALGLCQQVGETPELFPALFGLWAFYLLRAEYQIAHTLAERLLSLAQSLQDSSLLLLAHFALGDVLFWLGELVPARKHLEQSTTLYDSQQYHSLAFLYGATDVGVASLCMAVDALWHLGYPDQALQRSQEALTLAQELSHPFSLAWALERAAAIHHHRREGHPVQERAEALMALSTAQGFLYWLAVGTVWRGWALAEQGQREEGIAQIRQGQAALRAMGAKLGASNNLATLAEAYGKGGQAEEGLALLAEAFTVVQDTGERFREAELYRLKGELLLAQAGKLRD